ncbi:MAG: DpnII family type II restriction endonuclease [Thiotrichaceae bacterium]
MNEQGGGKANRRGKMLEGSVESILRESYEKCTPGRFFALRELEQPIFARECRIGKDLYGKQRRVDFILYHSQKWPDSLVIQCKWQASSGSVEEKYPFEVLSIELSEFKAIIILDGDGYSTGSKKWLQDQAGKKKLLHVMSLADFQRFCTRGDL